MKASAPVGDVLDRITILSIKVERLSGVKSLNAHDERAALEKDLEDWLNANNINDVTRRRLENLRRQLLTVNKGLWDIEDNIRICERNKDFGPEFIELARAVYQTNDQRAYLKRLVNDAVGSKFTEEKGYEDYS